MQEFLRVAQAARRIGVSEKTIRAWFKKEQEHPGTGLKFIRLPNGERRVPAEEADRFTVKA